MTLTDEQSYLLDSQLNAIVGFAEVLLDEAGNRATAAEHQEYLQHIKDSGARLAGYVHQLTTAPKDGSIPSQPAGAGIPLGPPASRWAAPTVLVADTDAAVRDRIEAFLSGAGYQVEFASDTGEALKTAARLQPLAIMIDAALPPSGAMGLVDELLREPRTRDIPVVLTVRNNQEQLGLDIGRYDFLTKPIDQQQVLQMMVKYDLLGERRRANKMPASVLVVDDDRPNTRLVEAMLKPFKIDVLVADGGAAGIKLAFERKPDLVILDLMMPQVDGFEVVSALREDSATSQIPILIYTAKKITSDDRRRLQGNIQSIIRKGEQGGVPGTRLQAGGTEKSPISRGNRGLERIRISPRDRARGQLPRKTPQVRRSHDAGDSAPGTRSGFTEALTRSVLRASCRLASLSRPTGLR